MNQVNSNLEQQQLADRLLPDSQLTWTDIAAQYPARQLPDGAMVTRIAPSPTGFMHIGGIYTALICQRLARQSKGVFFLRIEDTDKEREVAGAAELIVDSLTWFGLAADEGQQSDSSEIGHYGPYRQSDRKEIYQAIVKQLIIQGQAYPAFETPEELAEITAQQTANKVAPGYYGAWAKWRDRSVTEALAALDQGLVPVVRLRSMGDRQRTMTINDLFKGPLNLPENDQDIVLLKSTGLPTYHLAHVIDDHLMGTTHVLRGDEWLSSLPLHYQLFQLLGWTPPVFGHLAPIQKLVNQSRRKLSKRHDPEASVSYYQVAGYPVEAVISYLLNLANSGFEEWFNDHPTNSLDDYQLSIDQLKKGAGALLDLVKLASFSKELISRWSVDKIITTAVQWAQDHDPELAKLLLADPDYTRQVLSIDRQAGQVRKDIAKWSDLGPQIGFFFDQLADFPANQLIEQIGLDRARINQIGQAVVDQYDPGDQHEEWLAKLRQLAVSLGYAPDQKTFKQNPQQYHGHFGDLAKIIRILLTGRNQSPDLFVVMQVLGLERVAQRLTKLA